VALSEDQKAMLRLLAQREEGYEDIGALTGIGVGDVRARVQGALAALKGGGAESLSEDQRAMLRLLAQREEGYDDIGALMGLSVNEVRVRVRGALSELEGGEGAPVATPPPPPPEQERAGPAPDAEPKMKPRQASKSATRTRTLSGSSLLENKRLLGQLLGCALIVVLLILFATGVIDVGGSGSESAGSEGTATAVNPTSTSKVPTQAVLSGVGGSEAEGRAIFGRLKSQVLLVVAAKGLARSPEERIPIAASKVGKSGTISGQFQVPATALGLLAGGFDEMEVSLVSNGELRVAVSEAQKKKKTPQFKSTDVLRGPVTGPVVENGKESG
jgi:hypothetical protein